MLIGIDVGGTKTHVLMDDGTEVRDLLIPTAEWRQDDLVGAPATAPRLLAALPALPGVDDAALAIGSHGLDSDRQVQAFSAALRAHRSGPVLAVNDVELLLPAAGIEHGVAVVVGTGSKVVGHDAAGDLVAAGGYGFLLSDPGSAPALAFAAAKAVLAAHDAGEIPDALGRTLMDAVDATDALGVAHVFSYDIDIHRWGALAPLVFEAADASSAHAVSVIEDAADLLALDVERVLRRGALGRTVVCAGGVVGSQPRLFDAIRRRIADRGLPVDVVLLEVPPVHGALELARRLHRTASLITL